MTRRRITIEASEEDVENIRQTVNDACLYLERDGFPDDPSDKRYAVDEDAAAFHPLADLASRIEAALREEER